MQKVLFAINKFSLGGAERLVVDQVNELGRKGYEVHTLTLLLEDDTTLQPQLIIPSSHQHAVAVKGMCDVRAFNAIKRLLVEHRFDTVVTNLFLTNTYVRAAAHAAGVPHIFSYEHSVYADKRAWQIMIDRFLARYTEKIIVGASDVQLFTAKQEHLSESKFALNHNAADMSTLHISEDRGRALRERFHIPEEAVLVVAAGRLIEQKGHQYLIEAASHISENMHVLIFGKGTLEQELQALIVERGLGKKVQLAGIGDMSDILSATDVFCMPSLWEGLSVALTQAMAAGRAIVATDVSGTNEALQNEKNGLLVPPKEVHALANALQKLALDAGLRSRFGRAAQDASSQFSIEENVKRLEAIMKNH